ncbi:MAG: hypothetical protein WCO58_00600 [bacterium]
MKNILFLLVLASVLTISLFSCNSENKEPENQTTVDSSQIEKKPVVKRESPQDYVFVPRAMEVTIPVENNNDFSVEYDNEEEVEIKVPCHSYTAKILFTDSLFADYTKTRISWYAVDFNLRVLKTYPKGEESQKKEDEERMAKAKRVFNKIINMDLKNLLVIKSPGNIITVKENLPLKQKKKLGNAYIREEENNILWEE